jgi:BMFP domain-containing protein YqiC
MMARIPQGGETDMEEKDFQRIEEMMARAMGKFRGEIGDDFRHQLGLQREDFQHKLDLVVEGQQMLAEKLERVDSRVDQVESRLTRKVDAIAADITAHRHDTEAHRKGWRVREEGGE